MAEPQFPSAKIAAMDDRQIQFLSSLNSVFKEYQDQMQSLPKMIDSFLQTSSPRSNDVVENRKKEFELQEMTKEGKELTKKKNETMKADGQREEEHQKINHELQEAKEKVCEKEREILEMDKKIKQIENQREEDRGKMQRELEEMKDKLSKTAEDLERKDRQILEIERQHKAEKKEFELQEMTKEGRELTKKKNETMKADGQREEEYRKINRDLQEAKKKVSKTEAEIIERDKKIKEIENQSEEDRGKMQRELEEMKDKLSKTAEDLERKDRQILEIERQHKADLSKMSGQLESVQSKKESYKSSFYKVSDELKSVQMKMESYKSRLASLSEKNVQQDQRKVEDISVSNRPSELEKDFCAFFDDDRVDACMEMQSIYCHNDSDYVHIYYPRLACLIFETAYEQAKEVHEAFFHTFTQITNIMMNNAGLLGQQLWTARKMHMEGNNTSDLHTFFFHTPLWGEGSDSLKDVVDEMNLVIKEVAPTCNVETLTQDIALISYLKWEKWCEDDGTCLFSPCWNIIQALEKYIFACIKLTWRMVTQMPPMKLEYHCSQFNKDIHKKASTVQGGTRASNKKDQGEDIRCYLWPGLQDGGGKRIRQGEVLCKLRQK